MKRLISFSGAQSTGKSTLLNACKEIYKNSFVFVPEITRELKRDFDVTINEQGTDLTQTLILAEHVKNYYRFIDKNNNQNFLLDRCILDGYVYTRYLTNIGALSDDGFKKVAERLLVELLPKHDMIFYTSPKDVKLVNDGERSTNIQFRDDVIEIFESCLYFARGCTNVVVLEGSVEDRMRQIKENILIS